jgi:hypothetical protein
VHKIVVGVPKSLEPLIIKSKENFEVLSAPEVMLYKARVSGKTCGNWRVQK